MGLTLRQLSVYLSHVPAIMAREAMTATVVTSMPYMDEDARMEVLQEWARAAGSKIETADRISMEDFREDIKKRVGA
jgi:hypothetical protein